MKAFILRLSFFSMIVLSVIMLVGWDYGNASKANNYFDAIIDKHKILDNTPSPRIILCGGSNLAFGIDSKKIEDATGLPVVNLGLYAGFGLEFLLNETRQSAQPGDHVIISPEYFLKVKGEYYNKDLISKIFPPAKNYFPFSLYEKTASFFSEGFRKNLGDNFIKWFNLRNNEDTAVVYKRWGFNQYGDMVLHLGKKPPHEMTDKVEFSYEDWEGAELINRFYQEEKLKNIQVYFAFPNYPVSEFNRNKKVLMQYGDYLSSNLQLPVLNKPEDFVFADTLFFDTVYHLNESGREKRTTLLIEKMALFNIKRH